MALATEPDIRARRGTWDWGPGAHESTRTTVPALLWALKDMGGTIEDRPSGRVGHELLQACRERGYPIHPVHLKTGSNLSALMQALDSGGSSTWLNGCIRRETNGKRTYRVDLLLDDDQMPPKPSPVKVSRVEDSPAEVVADARPVVLSRSAPAAQRRPQIGDTRPAPVVPATPGPVINDPSAGMGNGGPDPDYDENEDDAPAPAPAPEPDPTPDAFLVEPVTPASDPMALVLQIQQLTMQAAMAIAQGYGDTQTVVIEADPTLDAQERDRVAKRLATAIEQTQVLQRRLSEKDRTMAEVSARLESKVKECNGLRQAVQLAQANVATLQGTVTSLSTKREEELNALKRRQRLVTERPEADIRRRQEAAAGA